MLQSNQNSHPVAFTVYNPLASEQENSLVEPAAAPCETTDAMLGLFEEITGWKVEFSESRPSLLRRSCPGSKQSPPQGAFEITDMSQSWPADQPACHRAKCDKFVDLVGGLVDRLQATQLALLKSQSALMAFEPDTDVDDDELVDSFIPNFGRRVSDLVADQPSESRSNLDFSSADSEFDLHQDVAAKESLIKLPFEGWALGGSTGIVGNHFLDWRIDENEWIAISAGEIESESEREWSLQVQPLTSKFRLFSPKDDSIANQDAIVQASFCIWDLNSFGLRRIEPDTQWQSLATSESIIATTATALEDVQLYREEDRGFVPVADIAAVFQKTLDPKTPLLVLKYDRTESVNPE
jgi:hypothetical protein